MNSKNSQVTLLIIPRERFSNAKESLEGIFANTRMPFDMVYVDGGSPPDLKRYIEDQAKEKDFTLIRTEYYLFPNQARNMALSKVKTKYAVFVDNDIVPEPGWLKALVGGRNG